MNNYQPMLLLLLIYSAAVAEEETLNIIHTYSYIHSHIKDTIMVKGKMYNKTDSNNAYSSMM